MVRAWKGVAVSAGSWRGAGRPSTGAMRSEGTSMDRERTVPVHAGGRYRELFTGERERSGGRRPGA